MSTELIIVRHGRTAWNTVNRYQGVADTPLDDVGMQQAQALAAAMRGQEFAAIISSPLSRAWNTAKPVALALGMTIEEILPDPRLIERTYGVAEGLTVAEREERYPGEAWEGLEPIDDVGARALHTATDYVERYANQRILMVTHGTWTNMLLKVISNGEVGRGKTEIANTSRTHLSFAGGSWEIGAINLTDHLEGIA